MNKKLRFKEELVPLVLSGQKISTWRLWDDKNLSVGDVVDFINSKTNKPFATGKLTIVIEKPMGSLTPQDKLGHEKFESDRHMYETYSNYYKKKVDGRTLVKIIWFELLA